MYSLPCRLTEYLTPDKDAKTEYAKIHSYTKHLQCNSKQRFVDGIIKKKFRIERCDEYYNGLSIKENVNLDSVIARKIIAEIEKSYTWCVMKVADSTTDQLTLTVSSIRYNPMTIEVCFKTNQLLVNAYGGKNVKNLTTKVDGVQEFRLAMMNIVTVWECDRECSSKCLKFYHRERKHSSNASRRCRPCLKFEAARKQRLLKGAEKDDLWLLESCSPQFVDHVRNQADRSTKPTHPYSTR